MSPENGSGRTREPPMTDMDVTDGNDKGRHVQPQGFVPSHLAAPMLRDSRRTALEYVAEGLGDIRLSAAIMDGPLAARIEGEATRLQRLVKALASGALVAAFLAAGLVVGGPTTGRAEAAEGPEPDPVAGVSVAARTVPVVLSAAPVTMYVQATVYTETAPGVWCSSVWTAHGVAGRACAASPALSIPVRIDPRTFPAGRTLAQVVDDGSDTAVSTVILDARRLSRFAVGTWTDAGMGYLTVAAPIRMYSAGRLVPQRQAPVQVQERVAGRWVVRATFIAANGVAFGTVHLGPGRHVVRVARPLGATVTATTGVSHTFDLTTCDPPVGVI